MKFSAFLLCFFLTFFPALTLKTCFTCNGKCNKPLQKETCRDVIPNTEITKYLCQSMERTFVASDSEIIKGCVANTDSAKAECDRQAEIENVSCYYCEDDLCNSAQMSLLSTFLLSISVYLAVRFL
jgi:hypothetical protein